MRNRALTLVLAVAIAAIPVKAGPSDVDWVRAQDPAIYEGVRRALGDEETARFFADWSPGEVAAIRHKIDEFSRDLIEFWRTPGHPRTLPRQFALNLYGVVGEGLALAEFRRTQPPWARVVGDLVTSRSGGLHRPDGIAYLHDPKTGRVTILGIMESKITKNGNTAKRAEVVVETADGGAEVVQKARKGAGLYAAQYEEMLAQWKEHGLELDIGHVPPERIELRSGGVSKPLAAAEFGDFGQMVSVYQPRATQLSAEFRMLLPVTIEPWRMRYAALSALSLAMDPYVPDEFPKYHAEMQALAEQYRLYPRGLPAKGPLSSPRDRRILAILSAYDSDRLHAGISTVAPERLQNLKDDLGHHVRARGAEVRPKNAQASAEQYRAWKSGQMIAADPLEIALMRLRYEPSEVLEEFVAREGRWPARRLGPLPARARALEWIIEDRLAQFVGSQGGELPLLASKSNAAARTLLERTKWRPTAAQLVQLLSDTRLKPARRLQLFERMNAIFGPNGIAGGIPIVDAHLVRRLGAVDATLDLCTQKGLNALFRSLVSP